jgi:hypothetical protein
MGPNDKYACANRSCEMPMQMGSQRPIVQMIATGLQSFMAITCARYSILTHRNVLLPLLPLPMSSSWPTEVSKPPGARPCTGPHNLQIAGWLPRLADGDFSDETQVGPQRSRCPVRTHSHGPISSHISAINLR